MITKLRKWFFNDFLFKFFAGMYVVIILAVLFAFCVFIKNYGIKYGLLNIILPISGFCIVAITIYSLGSLAFYILSKTDK